MRITLPSGTAAEIARPPSGATDRGLVVVPDIMGLRPLFDDHVDHLARRHDWVVVAPELFPGLEDQPLAWRLEHAGEVSDARRLGDFVAAADATACERVAIIGFCMGGMYALKAAGTGRFDRAVAFYGMIRTPENWKRDDSIEPLDVIGADTRCRVMAIVGTADHWTPPDDVAELERAGATVVRYEGAEHGFVHDASRPAHRPDDAADAWQRAIDFIQAD